MNLFKNFCRKFFITISMLMVMLGGVMLSACDDPYKNMTISVDKSNVTIFLGETENDTETVVVTVAGGKNISPEIHLSFETDKVSLVGTKYLGDGKTEVQIKGNLPCNAEVKIQTAEKNKSTTLQVNVIQPLTNLSAKTNVKTYVMRGERKKINVLDYISFYPENTAQKNVKVSVVSNNNDSIFIETDETGTYLVSNADSTASNISVLIESIDRPNVSSVTINFEVLEQIDASTFTLSADKSINQQLYPNANEITQTKSQSIIYLAHNNINFSEEVLTLTIPKINLSDKNIIITPVLTNPTQAVVVKTEQTENAEDIIFKTTVVAGNNVGNDCYIYFNVQYDGYSNSLVNTKSYQTQIYSYDLIESLYLNGSPAQSVEEIDLYTNYVGDRGLALIFDVYPTTVHNDYRKLYISTNDFGGTDDKIILMDEFGNLLVKDDVSDCYIVDSSQKIYALAVGGKNFVNASIQIESKFTNEFYANADDSVNINKVSTINFSLFEGATELAFAGFEENEDYNFYFRSDRVSNSSQRIYFDVKPATAKVSIDNITVGENFEIVKYSLHEYSNLEDNGTLVGKRYFFDVKATLNNKTNLALLQIRFENGRNLYANLKSFVELDYTNVLITTESPKDSSAVGYLKYDTNGSVFTTALKNGNSAKVSIQATGCEYSTKFLYNFIQPSADNYDTFLDSTTGSYQEAHQVEFSILNTTSLSAFSILNSIGNLGKGKIQVKLIGDLFVANSEAVDGIQYNRIRQQDREISKYIFIEVYEPIKTFEVSEEVVTLYSYDSVGYYNKSNSERLVEIYLNRNQTEPTYKSITAIYNNLTDYADVIFDEDNNTIQFTALTTKDNTGHYLDTYSDGYITLVITEFEKQYISTVRLVIKRAEMVQDIKVHNVNADKGIYMEIGKDDSFKIDATVTNLAAFNKNLIYSFNPLGGTSSSILSIDRTTGYIKLNSQIGGKGEIVITPQDAFTSETAIFENAVQIRIPITIADGKNRETAFRITSLKEITNMSAHYILMTNAVYDDEVELKGVFTGALYGSINSNDDPVTITLSNKTLFETLNGVVEDVLLVGRADGAFVAKVNNGTINNVVVDSYTNDTYQSSIVNSTENAGGLVLENNGTISNSSFYGIVNSSAIAGGIAATNKGTILQCNVEFYKYSETQFGKIEGDVVGGIVGQMTNGTISECFVFNYHDEESIIATSSAGAVVGVFGGGYISKTFAKTNAQRFISTSEPIHNEQLTQNISNSYFIIQNASSLNAFYINNNKTYLNGYSLLSESPSGFASYNEYYNSFGISFEDSSIWAFNGALNDGYPYLKNVINEQPNNINSFVMQNTNQSLVSESATKNIALFYLYEKDSLMTTTNQENAIISEWNTISFEKLFGLSRTSGIKAVVSNDCIEVLPNGIQIRKTGDVTMTVFSKYDYTTQKTYNIKVIYAINDFDVVYDGDVVINGSVLAVKKGQSETMSISFSQERVAIDRAISLRQNEFKINFTEGNDYTRQAGLMFTIDTSIKGFADPQIFVLELSLLQFVSQDNDFINLLKSHFTRTFTISTYNGADEIYTDISNVIYVQPVDVVRFNVTILTDNFEEELDTVITDKNGNFGFNNDDSYIGMFDNFNADGFRPYTKLIYGRNSDGSWTLITERGSYQYFKIVFAYTINMNTSYLNAPFEQLELNFNISSNVVKNISTDIEVVYEAQTIDRIFFTNYEYRDWTKANGYVFKDEPTSVINPGMSSLLEINVYPNFANYQYIDITSSVVNSKALSLYLLTKDGATYKRINNGYVIIENGIRINNNYNLADKSGLGLYNILVVVPSDIDVDCVFNINVKAYTPKGEISKESNYILITRPLISSTIKIDGQDSVLLARGESAEIEVAIQLDQVLDSITVAGYDDNSGGVSGIYIDKIEETIDEGRNLKIYKTKVFVAENAMFENQQTPRFKVMSTVTRSNGGVIENKVSFVSATVVDFLVENISLNVDGVNKNNLDVYLGVEKQLDFNFTLTDWSTEGVVEPEILEAIGLLKSKTDLFKQYNNYFINDPMGSESYYFVNYHETDLDYLASSLRYKNMLNNLFYLNSDGSTVKVLADSGYVAENPFFTFEFVGNGKWSTNQSGKYLQILAKTTGSQNMRLMLNYLTPDGKKYEIIYDFSITVSVYTDEDKPTQITSAQEFIDIQNASTPQHYILMNDIELAYYIPYETTNILSFDGNNKVITIRSFDSTNYSQSSVLNLALWTSVSRTTLLKNVTVNYYHNDGVIIDTALYKNISIAGLAVTNSGIITNCHILAFRTNGNLPNPTKDAGLNVSYSVGNISTSITSKIAGLVINNTSTGAITNSRVGGETFTVIYNGGLSVGTYPLGKFTISGQGNIAGFVWENSGVISSSYANKIALTNNTSSGIETATAGFVGINTSGKITTSYAKGAYSQNNPDEIKTTGTVLSTSSIGAGFVYRNNSYIADSYSNIKLQDTANNSGRNSAGFVYYNGGTIDKCYSSSIIENSVTTQMDFNGVDDYGNLQNFGTITNSYYYSPRDLSTGQLQDMEESYGSGVLRIDGFETQDLFYGFSFAPINSLDGIWVMTSSKGPDLVSANNVAISARYVQAISQDDFILPYVEGYEYGSDLNPILIKTAEDFNNAFGKEEKSTAIQSYFDLENLTVFGNYRLINNIDISQLSSDGQDSKLVSSQMKLTNQAVFDGNSLEISNLELVASINYDAVGYGMFAQILDGSIVMNLNVTIKSVSASNVQNVGAITGILHNSKIANIVISSNSSSVTSSILGQNVVGGAVGYVFGNSAVVDIKIDGIDVAVDYFDEKGNLRQNYIRVDDSNNIDNSKLSYAGGVVGILDNYFAEQFTETTYQQDKLTSFAQASTLHVGNGSSVRAGTAGGVIGYSGINTSARDCQFSIDTITNTYLSKIISYGYSAGGIIGENYGDLTQSKIEHELNIQNDIESNVGAYYNNMAVNYNHGYNELFESNGVYNPKFVGGLIGQTYSGSITNSYSRANVISSNADFVGGLFGAIGDFVGQSRLARNYFNEIYAFGDVKSKDFDADTNTGVAGGIAGFIEYSIESNLDLRPDIIFSGVNAVNFFSREHYYIQNSETTATLTNIYDFYGATYFDNKFVLADQYAITDLALFTMGNETVTDNSEISVDDNSPANYVVDKYVVSSINIYTKKSVYAIINGTKKFVESKIEPLNAISQPSIDGGYMDVIFRNNNWDINKWERKTNELLPRIVYTTSSSIFYIRVAEDLKLLAQYPDKTFVIIGSGPNNGNEVFVDCSIVDEDFIPVIKNFRGVLKGYMPDKNDIYYNDGVPLYGLKNLKISKALIESTNNGAILSDFILLNSGHEQMTDSSILVERANGTIFRNLILRNCSFNTTSNNAGLVAGTATNSIFEKIHVLAEANRRNDFVRVSYDVKNTNQQIISAGLLVGKTGGTRKTSLVNCSVKVEGMAPLGVFVNPINNNTNSSGSVNLNVGGFVGQSESGQLELLFDAGQYIEGNYQVATSIQDENSDVAYDVNAGIVAGATNSFNMLNGENGASIYGTIYFEGGKNVQTLNIGGLIGTNSGTATINTPNDEDKINVNFHINNNANTNTYGVMSVGGVIGYATGSVMLQNMYVNAIQDDSKLAKVQDEFGNFANALIYSANSSERIGGYIGAAFGDVSIKNCDYRAEIIYENYNTSSSNENILCYGGAIGYITNKEQNTNSYKTPYDIEDNFGEGKIKIKNKKNVYAGSVIGAINTILNYEDSTSILIKNNIFGDIIDAERILDCKLVLGGLIGSIGIGKKENSNIRQTVIESNVAFGDVSLSNVTMSSSDILKLGGLVAESSSEILFNSNLSLTTIFTTRINSNYKNYYTGAIVADGLYNGEGDGNNYCSFINLANQESNSSTTPFASNLNYNEVKSLIKDNSMIARKFNINSSEQIEADGSKLFPYEVEKFEELSKYLSNNTLRPSENSRKYIVLTNNIIADSVLNSVSKSKSINDYFTNFAIFGNEKTVTINNDSASFIGLVDDKSIISGLRIVITDCNFPNTTNNSFVYKNTLQGNVHIEQSFENIYAPIAVNQGVIYGSNVIGSLTTQKNDIEASSRTGTLKIDSIAQLYVNSNYASGFVGINQGFIVSSYNDIQMTNIKKYEILKTIQKNEDGTDKVDAYGNLVYGAPYSLKLSKTAGFVAVNQGDITASYSMGKVANTYGDVYSFSYDEVNPSHILRDVDGQPQKEGESYKLNGTLIGSVSNSYTTVNCTESMSIKLISDLKNVKFTNVENNSQHSFVFGLGANSSCFYDIYGTGVEDKINQSDSNSNRPEKFITSQMNNLFDYNAHYQLALNKYYDDINNNIQSLEPKSLDVLVSALNQNGRLGWTFDSDQNYGYPVISSLANKDYNRIASSNFDYIFVPNIGVLQTVSFISNTDNKKFVLLDNFVLTDDMGIVNSVSHTPINKNVSNWESFALSNATINGNMKNISGIELINTDSMAENVGIFTQISNSAIENLIISAGKIDQKNSTNVGILAGTVTTTAESNSGVVISNVLISGYNVTLENVKNFGSLTGKASTENIASTILVQKVDVANTITFTAKDITNQNIGGLIGYGANLSVEDCDISNYLSITSTSSKPEAVENPENPEETKEIDSTNYFSAVIGNSKNLTFTSNIHSGYFAVNENLHEPLVKTSVVSVFYADEKFNSESNMQGTVGTNNIDNDDILNYNTGLAESIKTQIPEDTIITSTSFDRAQTPSLTSYELRGEQKPSKGEGSVERPYIVYTINDLMYCLKNGNSFILNNFVDLLYTHAYDVEYAEKTETKKIIDFYGQGNFIKYKSTSNNTFLSVDDGTTINIANLSIYNVNTAGNNYAFINKNNGLITKFNSFGISNQDTVEIYESKSFIVSGLTLENKSNIISSNNYKILIGTNGKNGEEDTASGPLDGENGNDGFDANILGGIAGKNAGDIFNCNNYGAIVGGNGGNGVDGEKGLEGQGADDSQFSTPAGNGGRGGNGGHASIIGGIAGICISNLENVHNITGSNYSPVISGKGGNGGNGGKGGNGGNAYVGVYGVEILNSLEGVPVLKIIPSIASIIVSIVDSINGTTNNIKSGTSGGGGGAGGNGGATIVGSICGLSKFANVENLSNDNSNIVVNDKWQGIGGKGGDGGSGGTGRYIVTMSANVYVGGGAGGGAGGNGFDGNSIINITSILTKIEGGDVSNYFATSGKAGGGASKDENNPAQGGLGGKGSDENNNMTRAPNGQNFVVTTKENEIGQQLANISLSAAAVTVAILGTPQFIFDDIIAIQALVISIPELVSVLTESFNTCNEANGGELIGAYGGKNPEKSNRTLPTISQSPIGAGIKRLEKEGNAYLINEYEDFYSLNYMLEENVTGLSAKLSQDINAYYPAGYDLRINLDGNGKTITIGNGNDYLGNSLFNIAKKEINQEITIDNVTIEYNIKNVNEMYTHKQLVAINYNQETFTSDVKFTGNIECSTTIEDYILDNQLGEDSEKILLQELDMWKFIDMEFNDGDGTSNNPYLINNFQRYNAFEKYVNKGSKKYYKLLTNITFEDINNSSIFETFYAHLDGGSNTTLRFSKDGSSVTFVDNFIENLYGSISNLTIKGYLNMSAIAQNNYGLIDNVKVNATIGNSNSNTPAAGFVINNYGTIESSSFAGQITNGSGAFGFAVNNSVLDEDVPGKIINCKTVNGSKIEGVAVKITKVIKGQEKNYIINGDAAGCVRNNYGTITNFINSATIVAKSPVEDITLEEIQNASDAAGIAIYNSGTIERSTNIGKVTACDGYAFNFDPEDTIIIPVTDESGNAATEEKNITLPAGSGGNAAGIAVYNYAENSQQDTNPESESYGKITENLGTIIDCCNTGKITAGKGGANDYVGDIGGIGGNGGNVGDITIPYEFTYTTKTENAGTETEPTTEEIILSYGNIQQTENHNYAKWGNHEVGLIAGLGGASATNGSNGKMYVLVIDSETGLKIQEKKVIWQV